MCTRTVLDDVLSTYWGEEQVFEERSYEMACEFGRFFLNHPLKTPIRKS